MGPWPPSLPITIRLNCPKKKILNISRFGKRTEHKAHGKWYKYTGGAQEMDFPEMSLYCNIHGDGPEKKLLLLSEN